MAGTAVAATVVVVVPAVLYPLVGVWTLLWLVLVSAVAGFLALGGPGAGTGLGTAARDASEHGPSSECGPHTYPGGARGAGSGGADGSAHAYADGPAHGTRVDAIALATAVPDYDLQLSAVVHWRWSGHVDLTVRNPVAPAVRDIVGRAASKVARTRPRDHARTECDLGAHLAVEHAVTGTGIVAWAEHVRLHLPEEDAERLARLSDLRKDLGLRAALQETERAYAPAYGHARAGGQGRPARGPGGAVHEPAPGHASESAGGRYGPVPPSAGGTPRGSAFGRRPWGGTWSRFGAAPEPDPESVPGPEAGTGPYPGPEGPGEDLGPFGGAGPFAGEAPEGPEGLDGPGLRGPLGQRLPYGPHPHVPGGRRSDLHRPGPGVVDGGEDLASGGTVHGPDLYGPGGRRSGIRGGDGGEEHDYVYLDPVDGMPEEPLFTGPGADSDGPDGPEGHDLGPELGPDLGPEPGPLPGHDVDEYGYESYWWPAETIPDSAEEDVQVAILRGMIDAVPDRHARAEFAEQQLSALEKAGYGEVARRVREGF